MDLNWQIDIINGLIRENPESTIKDYLKLLADILSIEEGDIIEGPPKPKEQHLDLGYHSLRDPRTGRFRPKEAAA